MKIQTAVLLGSMFFFGLRIGFSGEGPECSLHKAHKTGFIEIKQPELSKLVKAGNVFLVDANSRFTFDDGHIPGAVHYDITEKKFSGDLPKSKDALIVAYCGGPGCEAWCRAAEELDARGYKNIRHFKDGIKGWKSSGLSTEKEKDPT